MGHSVFRNALAFYPYIDWPAPISNYSETEERLSERHLESKRLDWPFFLIGASLDINAINLLAQI